jgi:hypothetical protein
MSPMLSGHVSADRLGEAAQTGSFEGLRDSERRHVEGCQKCRNLFAGYRMADKLLAANWRQTTLPASSLVREPARRRVLGLLTDFASGFEFRRFAPAALAIMLVAALGLAFELPQLIPATQPTASPSASRATPSATASSSASEGQASSQPTASALGPDTGPTASTVAEQSGAVGTPRTKATPSATPGSAGSPGALAPIAVSSLPAWPIAWAPDGRHMLLARVTAGFGGGTRMEIRDAAGRVTGTAIGSAGVWVDSARIAIATPTAGQGNHLGGSTISLVDVTGHQVAMLPGQYAGPDLTAGPDGGVLVGSGAGQLALVGQTGPNFSGATYVIWNGQTIGPSRQGVPIAFSQDGGDLAVIHPTYGQGGSFGSTLAGSLEIVSVSGSKTLAWFPRLRVAARSGLFSPNDSSLLVSGTLVDLGTGATTSVGNGGWLPDGSLVTVSNGQVTRWQGTHPAADPRFPTGGAVVTSAAGDIVEYFADGRAPLLLATDGTFSQLIVPGNPTVKTLLISPDGRSVAFQGRSQGAATVTVVATIK